MDTETAAPGGELAWTDVPQCTLPTAERPLRLAEFDDLFATSLRAIEQTGPTSVRLVLAGDPTAGLADRTRRLTQAETSCCSFFTFGVIRLDDERVVLDVEVPASYAAVLEGLADRARAAQGSAS